MKTRDILYLFFTSLILAYPLYAEKLVSETYRAKILYFVYAPLALVCLLIMIWTFVSSNIEISVFGRRLANQEHSTKSLVAASLKISSFEIIARYQFEYKEDLKAKIIMQKANPIRAYIVNTKAEKDYISFTNDVPKLEYPTKKTIDFKFTFTPESPTEVYGRPLEFLEKYDSLYFPWASFIHYLALLKVGGPTELSSDPILSFQVIINGRVILDQGETIKDLDPDSKVLIFRTEPDLFKDIEMRFLNM